MAEFGKWTSAIEDPPKETGTYLIIGTFGFVHDRENELCRYDQIAIGYYSPDFGWLSDTPGFIEAKYWMELPSDDPNKEENPYKLYEVYIYDSIALAINAKSESEAIRKALSEFDKREHKVKITEIGGDEDEF